MEVVLKKSKVKGKKYSATFTDKQGHSKTVSFGAQGYQDFTQHHDENRKRSYLSRHRHDPTKMDTAGELSRTILWSAPSLAGGIANFEKKHHVKIRRGK